MSSPAPQVWVIAGQHWPRALLRGELIERGCDAVGFSDPGRALRALTRPGHQAPRLIVLDLSTGVEEDVVSRFESFGVPVLLIAGAVEAARPWVGGRAGVLRRPLSVGAIAEAVSRLLAASGDRPLQRIHLPPSN